MVNERHQGAELKQFIKGSNKFKNQTEAAAALGMTRQNLSIYFGRERLSGDFLQLVKEKLGIILPSEGKPNSYYDQFGGTGLIEDPEVTWERAKHQQEIIELLKEKIAGLIEKNASLEEKIDRLEEKLKAPVHEVKTGGRRN